MTDPMDQPERDEMELVVPFIVCQSKGGPYDDLSFVAGFQSGMVDRALQVAAQCDAQSVRFTVATPLVPQLELLAMNRGFPVVEAESSAEWAEWSLVTFRTEAPGLYPTVGEP